MKRRTFIGLSAAATAGAFAGISFTPRPVKQLPVQHHVGDVVVVGKRHVAIITGVHHDPHTGEPIYETRVYGEHITYTKEMKNPLVIGSAYIEPTAPDVLRRG